MTGVDFSAFRELAGPHVESGLIRDSHLHLVTELARLAGEEREDVLLALALVVASTEQGDVGVSLERAARPPDQPKPELPMPVEAWLEAVSASALVGRGLSPERSATPFVLQGELLYTRKSFVDQARLVADIVARSRFEPPVFGGFPIELAALRALLLRHFPNTDPSSVDRQMLAVAVATLRRLAVIVGGPGTGKTFTIRVVLATLVSLASSNGWTPRIALCAPTGKAAARIVESVAEGIDSLPIDEHTRTVLAGLRAMTVHRLLGIDPKRPSTAKGSRRSKLPYDVVIVDESSMVDLRMMSALFAAVAPEARLVLLGDPRQLASVEAGAVLADVTAPRLGCAPSFRATFAGMLEAVLGAPLVADDTLPDLGGCIVELEVAHRFAAGGSIARLARAVEAGDATAFDEGGAASGTPAGEGLRFLTHAARLGVGDATLDALAAGYEPYLALLDAGPSEDEPIERFHARVLARLNAFRVLCVHRVGPFGAEAIARSLAARIAGRIGASGERWPGRPILITRSRYDIGLRNGDVGLLVSRPSGIGAAFQGEGGAPIRYVPLERLPPHELALAMTVHKAQGSQFDEIALVLPDGPSPILRREVVYTAITRARRAVTVVGGRDVLRYAIERPSERSSDLCRLLWET